MTMNSTKMLFLTFMFMSTMMVLSSNNWLGGWLGLEINLISFIPLIYNKINYYSSESSMKYFIMQAMGSAILLLGIIMLSMKTNLVMMMMFGLMAKLGIAPFHMWLPSVMESMNWENCLIISTWQKIATLMLLSYLINYCFTYIPVILCIIIGSIGGINQSSLKKLMAYSSINNLGWILMSMSISLPLWITYFLFYSLMTTTLMTLFNHFEINYINQCILKSFSSTTKIYMSTMMFSMGGLPPFLGFMPKFLVIQSLIMTNNYLLIFIMILTSLITLFYYIRICTMMILINTTKPKWNNFLLSNNNMLPLMMFINLFGMTIFMFIKFIN